MGAKMKLIDGWEKFYKLWSVRLTAIGTLIAAWFLNSPDAAIQVWLMLPQDLKDLLPPELVKFLPIFILGAGTFARVVKQNKLQAIKNDIPNTDSNGK